MNVRDRFRAILRGERVDRLPRFEWAIWWQETIDRWHAEGLPVKRSAWNDYGIVAIMEYFDLDPTWQARPDHFAPSLPEGLFGHYLGPVSDLSSYEALRLHLFPRELNWDTFLPPPSCAATNRAILRSGSACPDSLGWGAN